MLMRLVEPEMIPVAPTPLMTLPAMRAFEVGAVAHMIEPISKMKTSVMRTGKRLYHL